jgi:hypothetical protein
MRVTAHADHSHFDLTRNRPVVARGWSSVVSTTLADLLTPIFGNAGIVAVVVER